jgi:hypothetical protein
MFSPKKQKNVVTLASEGRSKSSFGWTKKTADAGVDKAKCRGPQAAGLACGLSFTRKLSAL